MTGAIEEYAPASGRVMREDSSNKLGYKGSKRYVRYKITETSAGTTGMVCSVVVIKGRPWSRPVP